MMKVAPEALDYFRYGRLLRNSGLPLTALAYIEVAEEMEPLNAFYKREVGIILYNIAEHERAIAKMDECLSLEPTNGWCNSYKGAALVDLGRVEEGLALGDAGLWSSRSSRCLALLRGGRYCDPSENYDTVITANLGMAVWAGDNDTAFRWIDHAIDTGHPLAYQFRAQTHSWPETLHADPRWPQALARIGKTDEWRDELCRRAQGLEIYTEIRVDCPS